MKHDRDCETSVIFVLFEGVPMAQFENLGELVKNTIFVA